MLEKQTFQASCLNLSKERYLQTHQDGMSHSKCTKHFQFLFKGKQEQSLNTHKTNKQTNKKPHPAMVGVKSPPIPLLFFYPHFTWSSVKAIIPLEEGELQHLLHPLHLISAYSSGRCPREPRQGYLYHP